MQKNILDVKEMKDKIRKDKEKENRELQNEIYKELYEYRRIVAASLYSIEKLNIIKSIPDFNFRKQFLSITNDIIADQYLKPLMYNRCPAFMEQSKFDDMRNRARILFKKSGKNV